jgi:hypothetical protein
MPWTDAIDPVDDRFHKRTADPYWNESSFVTFYVPERRMMGVIYFHFRPNMGLASWGPMLWDASGDENYNCLHYGMDEYMPMPEGCEMFDFTLPNGLTIKTVELQKRYQHVYDGPGCSFELDYTAAIEPYYMKERHTKSSNMSDWITDSGEEVTVGHYEQIGRMEGTIQIGGEDIAVDSWALRDHSWGPRPTRTNVMRGRGSYPTAIASERSAFNLYASTPEPLEEDPLIGSTERIISGFHIEDGVIADLEQGTCRTERDDQGLPIRIRVEGVDTLGRELHAEGEFLNRLKWSGVFGDYVIPWCLTRWSFNGQEGVIGENWDYMTYRHYRKFWAQRATAGTAALAA